MRSGCISSVSHFGKGLDDVGDGIILAHVVQVQRAEADGLIEVADDLHVLQLRHDRVLESLLEQVVVCLLELTLACRGGLLALELAKKFVAGLGKLAKLDLLLGLLTTAVLVDLRDVSSDTTLDLLEDQGLVILLLAELLLGDTLLRALLDGAVLLELLNLAPSHLQLLDVLGLGSLQLLIRASLPLLEVLLKPVEVDRVLDHHALKRRLLVVLLSELALHVLEKRARANLDVCDLDSGEMDAPALHNGGHLFHDSLTQCLPILDDVVDGGVGNLIANDRTRHAGQCVISAAIVARG